MSNLILRERPTSGVDFYLDIQYDSTSFNFPFEFSAVKIFVNDDQAPLAELRVKGQKVWNARVDFSKYYSAGIYKLRVESSIWIGSNSGMSVLLYLKLGEFTDVKFHAPPLSGPPFPFSVSEQMRSALDSHIEKEERKPKSFSHFVDEWTVDYPG